MSRGWHSSLAQKGQNTKTSISKRAEPSNQSASVFLPKSSNTHLFSQPQSICKTGIRCSAPPRSRRPGNAQLSPATLISTQVISLGARPAEGLLRPVNQVTHWPSTRVMPCRIGGKVDRRFARRYRHLLLPPVGPRACGRRLGPAICALETRKKA